MSEKKFGVWEQPKDGSANGCWTVSDSTYRVWKFDSLLEAQESADEWNKSSPYMNLCHEVRELPEAWWNLTGFEIFKLIRK